MQKIGLVGLLVIAAMLETPKKPTEDVKAMKVEHESIPVQPKIESKPVSQFQAPTPIDIGTIKKPLLDEIDSLKTQLASLQEVNRGLSKELEASKLQVVAKKQVETKAPTAQVPVTYYYYSNGSCSNGSCGTGRRGLFGLRRW